MKRALDFQKVNMGNNKRGKERTRFRKSYRSESATKYKQEEKNQRKEIENG